MIVEERNIDVGGLPVNYLRVGKGPPLVLLHALGESPLDWRWVLPTLARANRVYAVNIRLQWQAISRIFTGLFRAPR